MTVEEYLDSSEGNKTINNDSQRPHVHPHLSNAFDQKRRASIEPSMDAWRIADPSSGMNQGNAGWINIHDEEAMVCISIVNEKKKSISIRCLLIIIFFSIYCA